MPTKPLRLYKDISPGSSRLRNPGDDSPRVLIVGGGVTGLVTAWTLLDAGYHVTILAKEWATWTTAQRLTSQIAGALWEFPPAVCGKHTDKISLHYSKRWAMISYHIWRLLAEENIPGVAMKLAGFFFARPIEEDPEQLRKMKEIMSAGVEGFRRDASLVEHRRVDASYAGGVTDAYEFLSPVIDTDVAMEWLMQLVEAKGGNFVTEELDTDLLLLEESLRSRFGVDVIVNCTGLGSTTLAGDDSCYPLRGACIRIINDGKDFPKVESALCITADAAVDNEIVFIVPRSNNILYLGGITQPGQTNLDLTLQDDVIERMRARCEAFLPDLKNAHTDAEYPLAQGLRPFRGRNVRVERELRLTPTGGISRIVHSYGQGGAGWSLAFGCASDVKDLVREALRNIAPAPMRRAS